jgi:hypothetical protein
VYTVVFPRFLALIDIIATARRHHKAVAAAASRFRHVAWFLD